MIVYILLLLYITVCGILVFLKGVTPQKNKIFVFLAFAGILLVQSLRSYQVGWDSADYYYAFLLFRNGIVKGIYGTWEPLYVLLNRIIGYFTANPQWLFFIGSIIIDAGVIIFILYNTEKGKSTFWPVLFWVVFLNLLNSMNLFRQYIAFAFVCNIFTLLIHEQSKRTYFWSAVLLIIGMGFHYMSLIAIVLFVPFILKFDDKKALFYAGFFAICMLAFADYFVRIGLMLFPKYAKYVNTTGLQGGSIGGFYIGVSLVRIVCIVVVALMPNYGSDSKKYLFALSFFMIVSIAIYLLKSKVILFNRVAYFFDIFQVVYYSRVIDKFKLNLAIKYFVYFFCWGIYIYTLLPSVGARGCVPYTFFWQV